jgi:two-component system, cell cycle sensor histidine kinase and response regulator CckA
MPTAEQTILVVEDAVRVRALIVNMLTSAGYKVLEADGLETLQQHLAGPDCRVDLLLTDLTLPGVSGIEVANHVLRACPNAKVLYMSGYELHAHAEMAFIEKPFRSEQLLAKIQEMLPTPPPPDPS